MTHSNPSPRQRLFQLFEVLKKHRTHIIIPTILGMVLAAVYAVAFRAESWSARQSLTVRDDLLGQSYKPGRFESLESMKSAQETIFEISRKPQVIGNALRELGPESRGLLGLGSRGYPSDEVIETVQGTVSFSAPNGAEFGTTEVIILNTKASTRERSKKFIDLLVDEIISKVNELRLTKFRSMASELEQNVSAAEQSLEQSKQRLREMDIVLGEDAGGMASIGESSFRDDPITREMAQLNLEMRGVKSEIASAKNVRSGLLAAKNNPGAIVNISSEVAIRQPELNLLKQELVKRKGELALALGQYTKYHPKVDFAKDSIVTMEKQIRMQLDNAVADIENQISVRESNLKGLEGEISKLKARLANLGENRADGLILIADVKNKTEILNKSRSDLAEVQGLASSKSAALLTKVDQAQVSTRPDGMGKKALILAGGLGGFLLGLGWVMLIAPPTETEMRNINRTPSSDPNSSIYPESPRSKGGMLPQTNSIASNLGSKVATPTASAKSVLSGLVGATVKRIEEVTGNIKSKSAVKTEDKNDTIANTAQVPVARPSVEQSTLPEQQPKPEQLKPAEAVTPVKENTNSESEDTSNPVRKLATQAPPIAIPLNKAKMARRAATIKPKSAETNDNPTSSRVEKIVAEAFGKNDDAPDSKMPAKRGFKIGRKNVESSPTQEASAAASTPSVKQDRATELEGLVQSLKNSTDNVAGQQEKIEQSLTSLESIVGKQVAAATSGKSAAAIAQRTEAPTIQLDSSGPQAANAFEQAFNPPVKPADVDTKKEANAAQIGALKKALGSKFPSAKVESADKELVKPKPAVTSFETNPFIKNRPKAQESDQKVEPIGSQETVPVPDQIKRLSDSIASFARPFAKKKNADKEQF